MIRTRIEAPALSAPTLMPPALRATALKGTRTQGNTNKGRAISTPGLRVPVPYTLALECPPLGHGRRSPANQQLFASLFRRLYMHNSVYNDIVGAFDVSCLVSQLCRPGSLGPLVARRRAVAK